VLTECQQFLVLHIWQSKGYNVTSFQSECTGRRNIKKDIKPACYHILKLTIDAISQVCPRFLALHYTKCEGCAATLIHNGTLGHLSRRKELRQHRYNVLKMSVHGASTILAFHLGKCKGCVVAFSHNGTIGCLCRRKELRQHRYYVLKMSVNRASTTFGLASWKMERLCNNIDS